MKLRQLTAIILTAAALAATAYAGTVGLWLFDEQEGFYPSSVLNDAGPDSYFVILGRGGVIAPGKFGNALRVIPPAPLTPVVKGLKDEGLVSFGLKAPPMKAGRTVEPMTWATATFAAAFLSGDAHLRRDPFANASDTRLNIGGGDWTVECWLQLDAETQAGGVIYELGSGPRGENDVVTRLAVAPGGTAIEFFNQPSGPAVRLPVSAPGLSRGEWVHVALVHAGGSLRLYVNGRAQGARVPSATRTLPHGDEAYFSIGRDGRWQHPLTGALDELRISDDAVYTADFTPPASFARMHNGSRVAPVPKSGPPLLFSGATSPVLDLGSRRHVFLDDALLADRHDITFTPHPARVAERIMNGSGWISVVDAGPEDIRLYVNGPEDSVAVYTSRDGVHFTAPDLGREFAGKKNITITDPATVGCAFLDPNGAGDEKWKLVTGLRKRGGIFVYTSADGYNWRRHESAALPFWAGSAVNVFYDDQRQRYVVHNRTDYYALAGGTTDRKSVLTEVNDLLGTWPFKPVTTADTKAASARGVRTSADKLDPWWLDNGPLAPGGFGLEYPVAFEADRKLDPIDTDVYNTRAQKYPWADDTYVAFPLYFFHYHGVGPDQRQILALPDEKRGSGIVETQLAVSRDGLKWTRYPRPAYIGIGEVDGYPIRRSYAGYGMVRRGRELWQYTYSRATYHDPYSKAAAPDVIHRLIQRVDGFVSADAPYTGGEFTTKPFRFTGNRLVVNIDTDAAGYAQVGLIDEAGQPIPGCSLDECVYINGDEIDYPVEWLSKDRKRVSDVSAFAGKTVRLVVRMRGTSLYALQFLQK